MIKNILICTDGSAFSATAAEYAFYLGNKLSARVTGLHVLDIRMLEGPLMADISGWVGASAFGEHVGHFSALMHEKGDAVIHALKEDGRKAGLVIEAGVTTGHPARVILEEERGTELLVLGQKGEHSDFVDFMGSTVDRVVRRASNPCLVTPARFAPITRILASYDGSGHAAKALTYATELAQSLEAELLILTSTEGLDEETATEISEEAMKRTCAHNIDAESIIDSRPAREAIQKTAIERACNLISMGAYGHSRIREMILGSTTTQVMSQTELPILLAR